MAMSKSDDKLIKLRFFVAKDEFKSPEEKNGEGVLFLYDILKQIKPKHRDYIPDFIEIIQDCITQNGNLQILLNEEEEYTLLENIYDYILVNGNQQENSDLNLITLRNSWILRLFKPNNVHFEFFNKSFHVNGFSSCYRNSS